jgi:hypothetical protein
MQRLQRLSQLVLTAERKAATLMLTNFGANPLAVETHLSCDKRLCQPLCFITATSQQQGGSPSLAEQSHALHHCWKAP